MLGWVCGSAAGRDRYRGRGLGEVVLLPGEVQAPGEVLTGMLRFWTVCVLGKNTAGRGKDKCKGLESWRIAGT